jgi:hypothetical protein
MPFDATPADSEVVTVLKKARSLVSEPCNWCPDGGGWAQKTYCVGRAILTAQGYYFWNRPPDARALETFCQANGIKPRSSVTGAIAARNDIEGRTHDQILAGFDRAIILAGGTP